MYHERERDYLQENLDRIITISKGHIISHVSDKDVTKDKKYPITKIQHDHDNIYFWFNDDNNVPIGIPIDNSKFCVVLHE